MSITLVIAVIISMLFIGPIALIWFGIRSEKRVMQSAREKVVAAADRHIYILAQKRLQLTRMNAYSVVDIKAWNKEINYFFINVIEPTLTEREKSMLRSSVRSPRPVVISPIAAELIEKLIGERSIKTEEPNEYDPSMGPIEYEVFCAQILDRAGWSTQMTQASGDQGADVIARKNEFSVVIQCKQYTGNVGNAAIQAVFAAKQYYQCNTAAVVTTSAFTRSAEQLAMSTGVLLLHHDDLRRFEEKLSAINKCKVTVSSRQ